VANILIADFIILADSIAAQSDALFAMLGDGAGHAAPATISDSVRSIVEAVSGLADPEQVAELLPGFEKTLLQVLTVPNAYAPFRKSVSALNEHVAGINAYLTAQGERVPPQFKTIIQMMVGEILDAANTFSPLVADMGLWTCTGVGPVTETFVDGDAIDNTNYYASNLVLEKLDGAGGADPFNLFVTCTDWAGVEVIETVAVNGNDAAATQYDVGVHGVDMYIDVTDVAHDPGTPPAAGGTVTQRWQVVSELERVVAL